MKLTRRDFLLGAAGAAFLSRPLRSLAQGKKRVLVLGAGLSGLSAAYELALENYDVTVIEARNRIGGRVQTLREPFADKQTVELGGELIGDGYKRFLNYAKRFNIETAEISGGSETGGTVANLNKGTGTSAILRGELFPVGSRLETNPYNLSGDEAKDLPPANDARCSGKRSAAVDESAKRFEGNRRVAEIRFLPAKHANDTKIKPKNLFFFSRVSRVSRANVFPALQLNFFSIKLVINLRQI